jgi:tetratricopeptide (TPR) repeat protein
MAQGGMTVLLGGLFTGALFVKEQAVVLPFLFLAYLLTVGRTREKSGRLSVLVPMFLIVLVGGYFLYRKILLGHPVTPFWNYNHELLLRFQSIPRTLLVYSRILFIPAGLHYYRSLDVLAPNAGASLLLVLVVAAVMAGGRVLPVALKFYYQFGLLWFAVTLAPMLNIIPLIHEYSYIALFEHFLYWPLPGIFLSLMVVVTYVFESRVPPERYKNVRAGFILSIILVLTAITLKQNQVWRGEVPLFEQVVRYERNLARVHILLGKAYFFNGQTEQALLEFNQALPILERYLERVQDAGARGVYLSFKKETLFNMAQCFEKKRQWPQAVQYYQAALQITPNDSMILNNLGAVFLQLHQIEEAEQWFAAAVTADQSDLMAKTNLALCYILSGKETRARELLQDVLSVDPGFGPARNNWDILTNTPGPQPAARDPSGPPVQKY